MIPPNRQTSPHGTSVLLMTAAAVLWSTGGVLIKWVTWNPLAIAGTRSLIALPLLLVFFRKRRLDGSWPQIAGAFAYAATVMLFVSATKLTTAANAILLQYTAPFFVAVFSNVFLRERVKWFDWAAISVACLGMALFFVDRLSRGGYWGNILAVLSGVAFAAMILLLRRQKDGDPLGSVILGNAVTTAVCLPFMLKSCPDAPGWLGLALLGVFQLGLSYVLYTEAIRRLTALEGVLIPMVEPVLNPVWVFLLLGEKPGRFAALGGVVVVGSILARSLLANARQARFRLKKGGRSESS
jgi:drug/metabolite transporter (DMT)-like permease